jgi:putative membrane protein
VTTEAAPKSAAATAPIGEAEGAQERGRGIGMFIDYITLLLLNMVAGYFLLSVYVYRGLDDPLHPRWTPGFAMVGLIALVFGAHMTATWPVIGPYNSAYGEMSVLFGVVFLGAALAISRGWSLTSVTIFAFFAGGAAVLLGARIIDLQMTQMPLMSGVGFILSGLGGVFAAPTLVCLRGSHSWRLLGALAMLGAAAIWAITAGFAYWGHMESFGGWVPLSMRGAGGE